MKLKITAGNKLVAKYNPVKGLTRIHAQPDFIIECDDAFKKIYEKGVLRALFFGNPVGMRDRSGNLTDTSLTADNLNKLLTSSSAEKCMDVIEGRFLAVKINRQGFEVFPDRFGYLDVYYQELEDGIIVSTDLGMLPFRNGRISYDQVALAHALCVYGNRPAKKHTFYKNVKRLGVGEFIGWRKKISFLGQLPPLIRKTDKEYDESSLKRYGELLLDSVKKRSSAQGNVVYVSSGWDSTSILACMVKLYGPKKVKAVIGKMNYSRRAGVVNPFEIKRAKEVTDYYGVKLEIVDLDYRRNGTELAERFVDDMHAHMFSTTSLFDWAMLSDYVAQKCGCDTILAGEISDGVHNLGFAQFNTIYHPVIEFREYSDKMLSYLFGPTALRSMLEGGFEKDVIYRFLRDNKYAGSIFDKPHRNSTELKKQLLSSFFLRNKRFPFYSLKNCRLLTEHGRKCYAEEMNSVYFQEPAKSLTPDTLYSWYIHLYNSFFWQTAMVSTLWSTGSQKGLNVELPFRDSRLHEFLAAMPESFGRGLDINPTKYPLKWMLKNMVDYPLHLQVGPHSYRSDINPNFSVVGEFIYASAFAPYFRKIMRSRKYREVLSQDFFNLRYIDKIVNRYLCGQEVCGEEWYDIIALCYLCMSGWY